MASRKKTGGRKAGTPNKVMTDVRAVAQGYGCDAIEALAAIMHDATAPPAARVAAANALLDRGYGKARQTIDYGVSGDSEPKTLAFFYAQHRTSS
ncbi:hypothetical protein [Rhodanobacter geophilus]|uniref:Uncharacterized protein n=1 Tax=Rhodanobacter geophilus TaxID=3162488 RepID=A0ABV3QQ39_9GAMM